MVCTQLQYTADKSSNSNTTSHTPNFRPAKLEVRVSEELGDQSKSGQSVSKSRQSHSRSWRAHRIACFHRLTKKKQSLLKAACRQLLPKRALAIKGTCWPVPQTGWTPPNHRSVQLAWPQEAGFPEHSRASWQSGCSVPLYLDGTKYVHACTRTGPYCSHANSSVPRTFLRLLLQAEKSPSMLKEEDKEKISKLHKFEPSRALPPAALHFSVTSLFFLFLCFEMPRELVA